MGRGFKEINRQEETLTQKNKKQNEYDTFLHIYEHDSKIVSDARRRFDAPLYHLRSMKNGQ